MGEKFGEYDIVREIYRTNISTVYHARKRGADFAIKAPNKGRNPQEESKNREIVISGAEVQKKLAHENIIEIKDIADGFVAMEYFPHPNLESFLEKRGPLTFGEGIFITLSVMDAIEYVHLNNSTHGDLHKKNVLVASSETEILKVKVTDFGYNPELDPDFVKNSLDSSVAGSFAISLHNLSPEQMKSQKPGPSKEADIYDVGLVAWEIFIGKRPFMPMKKPSEENPLLPKTIDLFFESALEENPEKRATISQLKYVLGEISDEYNKKLEKSSPENIIKNPALNIEDLANRHLALGNIQEAEKVYEAAVNISKTKNPQYARQLFQIYFQTGKIEKALDLLKRRKNILGRQEIDEMLFSLVKAGIILDSAKIKKLAKFLSREQLAMLPLGLFEKRETAAYGKNKDNSAGVMAVLEGDNEKAMELFEKSQTSESFFNLGLLLFSMEEYEDAIQSSARSKNNKKGGIILASVEKSGLGAVLSEQLFFPKSSNERILAKIFASKLVSGGVKPEYYLA